MKKTIFVIGAGKGLGNAVARKFAENGFSVVLMSRSAEHLDAYRKEMTDVGIDVSTMVADASKEKEFALSIEQAVKVYGTPDVLFYNIGITSPDDGMNAEVMAERYRVDVLGAYTSIQNILGTEFSKKQGAILVTGGGLAMHPHALFLPLSMDKAALRAMVFALSPELKEQDVFIGTVQVCGVIGGSDKYKPERIAELFWKLYQDRSDTEIVY